MMRKEEGAILITTLWIMAILSIFAMGISFRSSLDARMGDKAMDNLKLLYIARAGIAKAEDSIMKDDNPYDSIYECGIKMPWGKKQEDIFGDDKNKIGSGSFSVYYKTEETFMGPYIYYGMEDEERKLNINTADETALRNLSEKITPETAAAITIWRTPDPNPEEDKYYNNSERPYACKHAEFESVSELALVRGITKEIFAEIEDYITVFGGGKININTASEKALNAVIKDEAGLYPGTAKKIISYRNNIDGKEGTKDDRVFMALQDLNVILDITETARLGALSDRLIFRSENFRIVSRAKLGGAAKTITCIVETKGAGKEKKLDFKYYHQD